jgi:O-antigen/teichoic acid export membrane protein
MRFVDSTIVLIVSHSVGLVVTFLVSVLVSRILGAEGKGVFSLMLGLATILFGISNLGLGTASQYFISRDPKSARSHYGNILFFPLILAILVLGGFAATFPIWQESLNGMELHQLMPVFAMLPLMLVFEGSCQFLVVLSRIRLRTIAIFVHSAVLLATAATFLGLGVQATGVSYSYALAWLVGGVVAVIAVVGGIGMPHRPSFALLRDTLRYSIWIWLANLIKGVFLRADFLFMYSLRGAADAGVYSVALALTSGMTIAFQAVVTIFHPRTSAKTDQEAAETTPRYYRGMLILMLAVGLLTAALSHPLLLIFGRDFLRGQTAMLILIAGLAVSGLNVILITHILGRGKSHVMTAVTILTLAVSAALNLTLIPVLGMNGAALATVGAYVLENLVLTFLYRSVGNGRIGALYTFSMADFRFMSQETKAAISRLSSHVPGKRRS